MQYCYKFSDHGTGAGGCTKGAACTFSHASKPAADKTARIKRRSESRSNSRGPGKKPGGKGDSKGRRQSSGPPRERKPKSETPCGFLKTPSGCRDGAKCAYSHTDAPPAAVAAADNEPVAAAFVSIELHESDEEPAVPTCLAQDCRNAVSFDDLVIVIPIAFVGLQPGNLTSTLDFRIDSKIKQRNYVGQRLCGCNKSEHQEGQRPSATHRL